MAQVGRWLARGRSEEGAQLVEFAFVLPVILLITLGIADLGLMFQRYEVVTNAAREGARMAVLPGYTPDDVKARVTAYLSSGRGGPAPGTAVVLVEGTSIPVAGGRPPISARRVTVTYTYTFQFLNALSAFFGTRAAVPLTAVAEMRTESGS